MRGEYQDQTYVVHVKGQGRRIVVEKENDINKETHGDAFQQQQLAIIV